MENKITKCVSCGAELTEGAKFCEKCGHAVEQKKDAEQYCSVCGEKIEEGTSFCIKCGHAFSEDVKGSESTEFNEEPIKEKPGPEKVAETPVQPGQTVEKKGLNKKIKIVIGVCIVVVAIFLFRVLSANDPIGDTKNLVFDTYTTETMGTIVEKSMSNVNWEKVENDKTHYTVSVSGFVPDLYGNVKITFDVNYVDDLVYGKIVSVVYDDEMYTDDFTIAYVMGMLTE